MLNIESKARGKGTAKGRRCALTVYPALPRWANLCRAYGAGSRYWSGVSTASGVETPENPDFSARLKPCPDVGARRNRPFDGHSQQLVNCHFLVCRFLCI